MRIFTFLLAGVLLAAAVGCARPPRDTIERAGSAVAKAKASGAALYAPETLAAAERAIAALEAELSVQSKKGRLSRSYVQAESLALEALIAGEKAAVEAERGKEKSKADALSVLAGVTENLREAEAMAARVSGKNPSAKNAERNAALREAGALLARARRAMEEGRFAESLEYSRSAQEMVDAVKRELRKTVSRPQKPVPQKPVPQKPVRKK
jgi:hypothetical protein